ncbi:MAG: ParB N-terminal domain-containing protein [Deltaproteobacteria bacterium]|nr:ParB N-terminal domain-containing protein [Deltaproteobacteria bacterium]
MQLSFGRAITPLAESIRKLGLLEPLLGLSAPDNYFYLLSGRRRLEALRLLGHNTAPLFILDDQGEFLKLLSQNKNLGPLLTYPESLKRPSLKSPHPEIHFEPDLLESLFKLFQILITLNQSRGFNQAELTFLAPGLTLLKPHQQKVLQGLLNQFNPKIWEGALLAADLPSPFLEALALETLDLENIADLGDLDELTQQAILDIFQKFHLSYQTRRIWIEWLKDLKRRDNINIPTFLAPLADFLRSQEKEATAFLFNYRYPELSDYLSRRKKAITDLHLPDSITLEMDKALEDLSATLRITFKDLETLKDSLEKLRSISHSPEISALWNLPWRKSLES